MPEVNFPKYFYFLVLILHSCCLNLTEAENLYEKVINLGVVNVLSQILEDKLPTNNAAYDFIVVGGGAAGCVLANRLSENPNWTVYLLEAGGVENLSHEAPVLAGFLQGTHSNWGYKSVPQKRSCFGMRNNECALPRGKILGGTSSINYMIYNRGNRRDFDKWVAFGNKGWSYEEALYYFLKSERANLAGLENSPYHNHTGHLSVEDVRFRTTFAHAFVAGSQQAGLKYTDYNGESQLGVSYVQATTRNGRRHSGYRAFIEPIQNRRRNLHVLTFARVTKVLIDAVTKRAYGVEFLHRKNRYTIYAKKEVILSAGAFNSPQILMLSGVGPADNLNAIKVPIIKDLPVGVRMYDHLSHFGPTFVTNTTGQTLYPTSVGVADVLQYYLANSPTTPVSLIGGVEGLAFLKSPRSRLPADWPDIELLLVCGSLASDHGTGLKEGANFRDDVYNQVYKPLADQNRDHFSYLVMHFHPKSVGRLWLKNRNPLERPIIDPKYFIADEDIEYILDGIKAAIHITEMPAMQRLGARLWDRKVPGCENYKFNTDNYWRCSIQTLTYTLHHQVATCRMGPKADKTTVVNEYLKVHDILGLRVIDTSIIPFPPTSHTNAMAFMIGEKGADMIKRDHL